MIFVPGGTSASKVQQHRLAVDARPRAPCRSTRRPSAWPASGSRPARSSSHERLGRRTPRRCRPRSAASRRPRSTCSFRSFFEPAIFSAAVITARRAARPWRSRRCRCGSRPAARPARAVRRRSRGAGLAGLVGHCGLLGLSGRRASPCRCAGTAARSRRAARPRLQPAPRQVVRRRLARRQAQHREDAPDRARASPARPAPPMSRIAFEQPVQERVELAAARGVLGQRPGRLH